MEVINVPTIILNEAERKIVSKLRLARKTLEYENDVFDCNEMNCSTCPFSREFNDPNCVLGRISDAISDLEDILEEYRCLL